MSATSLKCPACHRPLSCGAEVLAGSKTVYVYCGYGPCQPAELGGPGFHAATIEDSYKLLDATYRDWLEAQVE